MSMVPKMSGGSAYMAITNSLGRKPNVSLTYGQIILITMLASCYLSVASFGINMFNGCTELKGVKFQENLNKWIIATLAIAIAIPCTLFTVKMAGTKLSGFMMLLFGIFGIVASASVLNWNSKCTDEDSDDSDSEKVIGGINITVYILMLLVSIFLLSRSKNIKPKV